jgi:hypothetical protein
MTGSKSMAKGKIAWRNEAIFGFDNLRFYPQKHEFSNALTSGQWFLREAGPEWCAKAHCRPTPRLPSP